jgi:hypothetical protein
MSWFWRVGRALHFPGSQKGLGYEQKTGFPVGAHLAVPTDRLMQQKYLATSNDNRYIKSA